MSRRRHPLPRLRGEQRAASDPLVHASLSASAGTGKTQVLIARVLRLLLHGAAPQSILCVTFTKAGAAEMANRLGDRLARWVRMSDAELGADLLALGEVATPDLTRQARRLFARVIEAPGGLRLLATKPSLARFRDAAVGQTVWAMPADCRALPKDG